MKHSSKLMASYLIASLTAIQLIAFPAQAQSDQSESYIRSHYPIAAAQGFAATCPGGVSFGWIDKTFFEYPGSDIGEVKGETPSAEPTRTGYYVGAYQYTLKSRGAIAHRDSIIFCYDGDLRPRHPATVLNAWIIPATSPLKTCILTKSSKRLICSQ